MTRNGKIARLPDRIRLRLNRRLQNGEPGNVIVEWLNGLDEVKEMLGRFFGGRPVTEQNLSEWKQGGFLDWKRNEEASERVGRLVALSDEIDERIDERGVTDRIASVLAVELAAMTEKLLDESGDDRERWGRLRDAVRTLHLLRRTDHSEARLGIQEGRWEIEHEEFLRKERMRLAGDVLRRPTIVQCFGGGEAGERMADMVLGVEPDIPGFHESDDEDAFPEEGEPIQPNPAQSDQIAPNQTNSE